MLSGRAYNRCHEFTYSRSGWGAPSAALGAPPRAWICRDFGLLVSFDEYCTVGMLMGKPIGGALFIKGYFARMI